MTIRVATIADAPRLAELAGQLGYPSTTERTERLLAGLSSSDVILVAAQDLVVGCVQVSLRRTYTTEPTAELISMVVDGSHRGGGVGRALVAGAEEWAVAQGMSRMILHTNVIRAEAHAFYEHLGYGRVKEQRVYLKEFKTTD